MTVEPADPRLRIVYLGTPDEAVAPLLSLHDAGHHIVLVVTRPDKRRGRGLVMTPSPVKAAALELGLPVTDDLDDVLDVEADLGVVVAYGRLLGDELLEHLTMVNVHFSLLPRWRGAAPVERAILAGDERVGVCLMRIEAELDAGGVYCCESIDVGSDDTASDLRSRLSVLGAELLVARLAAGLGEPVAQVGEPTHAAKIGPADLELDWRRPADELARVVRVGGAWTTFRGERLKVHDARVVAGVDAAAGEVVGSATVATGVGALEMITVQPAGRRRQAAAAWHNGARLQPGEILGR